MSIRRTAMAQGAVFLTMLAFTPMPAQAAGTAGDRPIPARAAAMGVAHNLAAASGQSATRTRGRSRENQQTPEQVRESAENAARLAGLTCDVTDAQALGTVSEGVTLYEIGCAAGPGYIITNASPPTTFNCLIAAKQAEQARAEDPAATPPTCTLRDNADTLADVAPWAAAAGVTCTVDQVAWIGRLPNGSDRYEVGCANAEGAWIEVSQTGQAGGKLDCQQVPATVGACAFTTAAEVAAGFSSRLAGTPAADCNPGEVRYLGANSNGSFYELKCASGEGRVVRFAAEGGAFQQSYDCAQAANIGDGCKLTDASTAVAANDQARAARLAELNLACAVTNQRVIGRENTGAGREVVEFACSDRPIGLVAFLPAEGASGGEGIDCLTAKARTVVCQFTTDDQLKAAMTAMFQAAGKPCDVSAYRITGAMASGAGEVAEVKCAAGGGFFAELPATRDRVGEAQTCTEARAVGDTCQL